MACAAGIEHREGASGPLTALGVLAVAAVAVVVGMTAPRPALDLVAGRYEAVEAPPPEYANVPLSAPGVSEIHFDSRAELDRFCRDALGALLAEGSYFRACYVERLGVVALPSRWAVENKRERDELKRHEYAHVYGWRHEAKPLDMRALMAAYAARQP